MTQTLYAHMNKRIKKQPVKFTITVLFYRGETKHKDNLINALDLVSFKDKGSFHPVF
jgi:hypothetical protein